MKKNECLKLEKSRAHLNSELSQKTKEVEKLAATVKSL